MSATESRRARKRKQTADLLAETAWGLFEQNGFENVTMEAIAAAADVAKGTLYNYFPVKEALLNHCFHLELKQAMPRLISGLAQIDSCREQLRTFLQQSAIWSQARRHYLPGYFRYRMNYNGDPRVKRSGIDQIFATIIEAGMRNGEFRGGMPVEAAVSYLSYLYLATLLRWLNNPELSLPEELDAMLDLFLHGLEARP